MIVLVATGLAVLAAPAVTAVVDRRRAVRRLPGGRGVGGDGDGRLREADRRLAQWLARYRALAATAAPVAAGGFRRAS